MLGIEAKPDLIKLACDRYPNSEVALEAILNNQLEVEKRTTGDPNGGSRGPTQSQQPSTSRSSRPTSKSTSMRRSEKSASLSLRTSGNASPASRSG